MFGSKKAEREVMMIVRAMGLKLTWEEVAQRAEAAYLAKYGKLPECLS